MKSRKWLLAAVLLAAVVVVWMSVASAVVRDGNGNDPGVGGTGGGPFASSDSTTLDSTAAKATVAVPECLGARMIVFEMVDSTTNVTTAVLDSALAEVSQDGIAWITTPDNVKVLGTVGRRMDIAPNILAVIFREPDGNNLVPCWWPYVRLHCHTAHRIKGWQTLGFSLH